MHLRFTMYTVFRLVTDIMFALLYHITFAVTTRAGIRLRKTVHLMTNYIRFAHTYYNPFLISL